MVPKNSESSSRCMRHSEEGTRMSAHKQAYANRHRFSETLQMKISLQGSRCNQTLQQIVAHHQAVQIGEGNR